MNTYDAWLKERVLTDALWRRFIIAFIQCSIIMMYMYVFAILTSDDFLGGLCARSPVWKWTNYTGTNNEWEEIC